MSPSPLLASGGCNLENPGPKSSRTRQNSRRISTWEAPVERATGGGDGASRRQGMSVRARRRRGRARRGESRAVPQRVAALTYTRLRSLRGAVLGPAGETAGRASDGACLPSPVSLVSCPFSLRCSPRVCAVSRCVRRARGSRGCRRRDCSARRARSSSPRSRGRAGRGNAQYAVDVPGSAWREDDGCAMRVQSVVSLASRRRIQGAHLRSLALLYTSAASRYQAKQRRRGRVGVGATSTCVAEWRGGGDGCGGDDDGLK